MSLNFFTMYFKNFYTKNILKFSKAIFMFYFFKIDYLNRNINDLDLHCKNKQKYIVPNDI